jgi:transcriptional regulator GlxA family with amidase domain
MGQDAFVARALAAMKADPARRWTVAALARTAGLSRAAFARHFRRAVGTTPLRWLTHHRLRAARMRLVETDLALAAIALEVGYRCEFAFGKAFKRLFGLAPGAYRRTARVRFFVSAIPAPARATFRAAA